MSAQDSTARLAVSTDDFDIRFPEGLDGFDQDKEWFEVTVDGERQKLRIHDYDELYNAPGLYEALVYDALCCRSPERVVHLLVDVLDDAPFTPRDLRVLDLGAGNGVVGEYLRREGVGEIVGLDLIPEAEMAARRDRPNVYDDYLTADLTKLTDKQRSALASHDLNCLVSVAALGFGDIPPDAFAAAYNFIEEGGWVAMTIKEDFLDSSDESGFGRMLRRIISEKVFEIQAYRRYCHRVSIAGERIYYVAIVARKRTDIPRALLVDLDAQSADTMNHDSDESDPNAARLLGRPSC